MTLVTIQVLDGLERGQIFSGVPLPFTIGREDDNAIRLNDERVSRFHAKLQEDGGRVIITDLDSTNGTRVNGHPVQMRVLQIGDQLSIGRCLLVYGSQEEIAARIRQLTSGDEAAAGQTGTPPSMKTLKFDSPAGPAAFLNPNSPDGEAISSLFPEGPPEPPQELRPVQRAQVSDVLSYLHDQVRSILQASQEEHVQYGGTRPHVTRVDWSTWQRLMKLEMELAVYLRRLSEPEG